MPRKARSDSAASAIKAFQDAAGDIPVPDGIELRSDEERVIWRQFTRARAKDAWRDFDLVLLAKVVRLEADIRRYQAILEIDGPLVTSRRDSVIENPILRVIDTTQRTQLAVIRSMSLNQTSKDPRTLNKTAENETQARKALADAGALSLLASSDRLN